MPRLPLWLKIGWTIWLIVWAPLYWRQYGAQNFLFFCDIGNVLIGIALVAGEPADFFLGSLRTACCSRLSTASILRARLLTGSTSSVARNTCSIRICRLSSDC